MPSAQEAGQSPSETIPEPPPTNIEQLLDLMSQAARAGDRVSVGSIFDWVGHRSFGPLLLVAGLILVSPLSGIPGMPTLMGAMVLIIAVQLLFGRKQFWLPHWLVARTLPTNRYCKALKWLQAPARFIDRFLRERLPILTQGMAMRAIAVVCVAVVSVTPLMELVPFSASIAGAALAMFGLSMIARDGLLALIAFGFAASAAGLIVYALQAVR